MRILLTNDDGLQSEGLARLAESLALKHDVKIVAPEQERSGTSHAITIYDPLRIRERRPNVFSVDGTPADCVLVGIRFLFQDGVDAVVSGINRGPNLGTDILYSGTVAAARQGALMGLPSFAYSLSADDENKFDFTAPARVAARLFDILIEIRSAEQFLNINFPGRLSATPQLAVTIPSERIYRDHYESFRAPDGNLYCFLSGDGSESLEREGSDFEAIKAGKISVSPLALHPVNHETEELYRTSLVGRDLLS